MRRREFLGILATMLSSAHALAQQARAPSPKVGVLFPGTLGAERERLISEGLASELGSQKAALLTRSSVGDGKLLEKYADELAIEADLILAIGSASLVAARQASRTKPIVALDLEADPIAIGAAQSLNRPGGNVTGIFLDAPGIAGKWLQIIREAVPETRTLALLYDLNLARTQVNSGEEHARKLSLETLKLGIDQPSDLRGAFEHAASMKADAMLVHSSPVFVDQAAAIAGLALEFRMPTIGLFPVYAKAGGLFSYGPNNFDLFKQAGGIAGKILRGSTPAEFPIHRPVYLSFLINVRTANALKVTIPPALLVLADEIIE